MTYKRYLELLFLPRYLHYCIIFADNILSVLEQVCNHLVALWNTSYKITLSLFDHTWYWPIIITLLLEKQQKISMSQTNKRHGTRIVSSSNRHLIYHSHSLLPLPLYHSHLLLPLPLYQSHLLLPLLLYPYTPRLPPLAPPHQHTTRKATQVAYNQLVHSTLCFIRPHTALTINSRPHYTHTQQHRPTDQLEYGDDICGTPWSH